MTLCFFFSFLLLSSFFSVFFCLHGNVSIIPTKKTGEEFNKLAQTFIPTQQSSNHILMVAPTAFVKNIEATKDNHFMNDPTTLSQGFPLQ